jgi:hypothetical protein
MSKASELIEKLNTVTEEIKDTSEMMYKDLTKEGKKMLVDTGVDLVFNDLQWKPNQLIGIVQKHKEKYNPPLFDVPMLQDVATRAQKMKNKGIKIAAIKAKLT